MFETIAIPGFCDIYHIICKKK